LSSTTWHYTHDQLVACIRTVGISAGDIVSLQASLGRMGLPRGVPRDLNAISNFVIDAFLDVLGPTGTLIVPTYTYSIGRGETFEVETTPSAIGEFSEIFRRRPGVTRSRDPMMSTAGIGRKARPILRDLSRECYGRGSVFDNLTRANAVICTLGLGIWWATYCHYIEAVARAPFRFKKVFSGVIREGGEERCEDWIYFAAPYIENCESNSLALEAEARRAGILRIAPIGRAEIMAARTSDLLSVGLAGLKRDPWLTAKGPACEPDELIRLEDRRIGAPTFEVALVPGASMQDMIASTWALPRDPISTGYNAALTALARQVPMTIHRYPTGWEGADFIVPESWTCRCGALESADGATIFSTSNNRLHVASRSYPFDGEVARLDLLRHLHVHPIIADATPHYDLAGKREWGLCCSQQVRQSLTEDHYRVVIDTAFSYGALRIGEVVVEGTSDETVFLCAHLDGPMQVNDGLSGVVVGIDVMRALKQRAKPKFTYRLLIIPEALGSRAYLGDHRQLAARACGGIYVNLAGLAGPLTMEPSLNPASAFDRCCATVLDQAGSNIRLGKTQQALEEIPAAFHAAGIPMISIARTDVQAPRDHALAFREHRSDRDNPGLVSAEQLRSTCDAILAIIETWERGATFAETRAPTVVRDHAESLATTRLTR